MPAVLSTASAASVKGSTSLPFNEITSFLTSLADQPVRAGTRSRETSKHDETPSGNPAFICSEFSLSGDPASIDDQRCPGCEFCVVGTEIENRGSDFLADACPPDRNHRGNLITHGTFSETIKHFGGN